MRKAGTRPVPVGQVNAWKPAPGDPPRTARQWYFQKREQRALKTPGGVAGWVQGASRQFNPEKATQEDAQAGFAAASQAMGAAASVAPMAGPFAPLVLLGAGLVGGIVGSVVKAQDRQKAAVNLVHRMQSEIRKLHPIQRYMLLGQLDTIQEALYKQDDANPDLAQWVGQWTVPSLKPYSMHLAYTSVVEPSWNDLFNSNEGTSIIDFWGDKTPDDYDRGGFGWPVPELIRYALLDPCLEGLPDLSGIISNPGELETVEIYMRCSMFGAWAVPWRVAREWGEKSPFLCGPELAAAVKKPWLISHPYTDRRDGYCRDAENAGMHSWGDIPVPLDLMLYLQGRR